MSNRQDKIKESINKQKDFISARRQQQLFMLEQAYEVGLNIYETNKDKLSPEEIEKIEDSDFIWYKTFCNSTEPRLFGLGISLVPSGI